MSIQVRLWLAVGIPAVIALALFYAAAVVPAPGDGLHPMLFWYACLVAAVGAVWGPSVWGAYRAGLKSDVHDDEIADLRCTNRRLETDIAAMTYALAALAASNARAIRHDDVPRPPHRLYTLPRPDGRRD